MDEEILILDLLKRIEKHNERYRMGYPMVSDAEYDKEVEELRKLAPNHLWFSRIEPAPVSNARKVKLPIPMKSLDKAKDLAGIKKWIKNIGLPSEQMLIVTPKFDGVSLLVNETTGQAYSRGGAENEGQDCTKHAEMMGIQHFTSSDCIYTYGEVVFARKDWQEHFEGKRSQETGDLYKSPRNTAAGFINRDTPSYMMNTLTFYRYGTDASSLKNFRSYVEFVAYISSKYNQPSLYYAIRVKDLDEESLMSCYKEWAKQYYIDGLVLYINDLDIWNIIGRKQNSGNPLYAIAYKHPDFTESFETTVKSITWNASKTGALKPVVNIDTVDTGDCNMENPTGYNASWVHNMGLAPGAKILVTRSGGVIPKILATIQSADEISIVQQWNDLMYCPYCGFPTHWNEGGVELCCSNLQCPGTRLAAIEFFYTICGADNMGESTFAKLFDAGFDSLPAMLDITVRDILQIEGFGPSAAQEIVANNTRFKQGLPITMLIQASNCFVGIGQVKAQKLIDELSEDDTQHLYAMQPLSIEMLPAPNKTMQAFIDGLPKFREFMRDIPIPIVHPVLEDIDSNGVMAGKNVCFSGVRSSEAEKFVIANGGKIASGISKTTGLLVVKDVNGTSSKISKAKALDVPIMSMEEFTAKYL